MLLIWTTLVVQLIRSGSGSQSDSCNFNSMCTCSLDQQDVNARKIHSVSCLSVPFYKFPNLPETTISQLEVVGSLTTSLEAESLAGCQVQALILANNRLQHVADRAFSSLWKSLTSLDLSYNRLDTIPFLALKDLRNIQWINFHGNGISSISGNWSQMTNTLGTLFLGENDIREIHGEMSDRSTDIMHGLYQLKSLIWLNLDGNRIYKIHKHSLPLALQTISVSHNLIENFPLDIIATSPHLQWLYLRGNHIRNIPDHVFSKKLWLEKVDVAENYLRTLPKFPFNNSVFIRDLNLAFNDFRTLTAESFSGLQCGRIILSYNQLDGIEIRAFDGIQESLEYLDLDHNNLQHVPQAISQLKSLKYLYLSSNSLSQLSGLAFESFCVSLKAVSLSGNRLTHIPADALQNCTKVSHFNMAFNEIAEVSIADFYNWSASVKSLILGNNRLTSLHGQTFSELQALNELSLSFNQLRVVDPDVFVGLGDLESLELSSAFEGSLFPSEIFKPLNNLKWLSIDNNNFDVVPDYSFDALPELKYLNMESNKIRDIPSKLLKATVHSKLEDVRLTNNELTSIKTGAFKELNNLDTIMLSGNHIRQIHKNSFSDLAGLKRIILADNEISQISSRAFSNLQKLSKIDLQNNLIVDFSFSYFANVSSLLQLNLSRNSIRSCDADYKILNIEILDLRHNLISKIPKCLENVAQMRKLYIDHNALPTLEQNNFMHLTSLEFLSLGGNKISRVSRKAFFGLQNLQVLDLTNNAIHTLYTSQFANMPKLRILNLAGNRLNYLPKDIFSHTVLEMLDISRNAFSVVPGVSLSDVGLTLRRLSIASNNIEHIDSTTFPDIPYLQHLDLGGNKLTILPDNVFASLGLLQSLDLSSNPLRANFKELFHYAQSLKDLSLANTGMASTPHLPLPNLVHLNLSHNHIEAIYAVSFLDLTKLKYLDLSHNLLFEIPSYLWIHLPLLKDLSLSHNPIKQISSDSFHALPNLQYLNLEGLRHTRKFDGRALMQLKSLMSLTIQTWPKVENFADQFCNLLTNLHQLRILKLHVSERVLDEQLLCVSNRKIRQLEITGRNLRSIDKDAFIRFSRNPDLVLRITGTGIEELPAGLFANMYKIQYLTVDLSHNKLTFLSPDIFYGNTTTWKSVGTTLVSGGLTISGNPFRCGCHLAWLGHWLRRWMRETLQSHIAPVETAMRMHDLVKEATCTDTLSGRSVPIVRLLPKDMSCHASALSAAEPAACGGASVMLVFGIAVLSRLSVAC